MESKVMMILGGYGGAGYVISRLLLQETDLNLILAGRNGIQAKKVAEQLNSEFSSNHRVQGMQVNAKNNEDLREAFKSCDTVMCCIPITSSGIGGGVAQAAFDAGIHHIDLAMDNDKRELLRSLGDKIKESGKYHMIETGFVPGVPSMMAFLANKHFDSLEELEFSGIFKDDNATYGSVIDLMTYAADPAYVCKDGVWHVVPMSASKKFDFGPEFEKVTCYPMDQYELRCLPKDLGLKEVAFYTSGVNGVTDLLLFALIGSGLYKFKWSLKLGTKLVLKSIKKYTKPPYITRVSMDAKGILSNQRGKYKVTLSHEDAFVGTAIPTVAGVLQLLDGTIKEPGVFIMGHRVDPERYIEDIKRMGMTVQIEQSTE